MSTLLCVSRSGYYEWLDRPESRHASQDHQLLKSIRLLHARSREAYGAYKTWKVLQAKGIACGRHRVARLRRENGIEALRKRRFRSMAELHRRPPPAANILAQNFHVAQPNRVWAGDMAVIPTGGGWLHLAIMLALYSRRVVGWAMGNERSQGLSLKALRMAIEQRRPGKGLLHHSDQGSAYVAGLYRSQLERIGAVISMSRRGNCYDNAVVESFFGNLKNEMIHHRRFASREQARAEIFDYIELFYNRHRAHTTFRFLSPVEYENANRVVVRTGAVNDNLGFGCVDAPELSELRKLCLNRAGDDAVAGPQLIRADVEDDGIRSVLDQAAQLLDGDAVHPQLPHEALPLPPFAGEIETKRRGEEDKPEPAGIV